MSDQRRRHRQQPPARKPLRLVVQALVLAFVVASTSAFTLLHKSVPVQVDGTEVTVEGFARTVGDLLAAGDITVGEHDLVVPALDQSVSSGSQVVVRHARQLDVEIDGAQQTVWTTATSVGEAVDELGLRDSDVRLSASRSDALGRDVLRVSTPKVVHVAVDGQTLEASTSGGTVRDALKDVGLVLNDGDQVSVPLDADAVDGLVVLVTRSASTGESAVESIPFETEQIEDATLTKGTTKVVTAGKAGVRTTTYQLEVVGGVVVGRTAVASVVTTEPVTRVEHIGTAEVAVAPAVTNVDPGSAQAVAQSMMASHGWDDAEFACLVALWNRESGWRVNAENKSSGAYGIPQALPGSKMASAGADWQTNAATQITWGLGYISGRYGTPCSAYQHLQSSGWY
ncbi:MAG: ubiquitin-like domain-containing protein [Cellulomonas sp.]|nr:ubiquitin-like domain-containing protein [Cellulomonas sp.]